MAKRVWTEMLMRKLKSSIEQRAREKEKEKEKERKKERERERDLRADKLTEIQ